MNNERSRGVVPPADIRQAVGFVTDYLWEEELETYEDIQIDGEPRRCCFDELQVIVDWLMEQEQHGPGRGEQDGNGWNGFSNSESGCVHRWFATDLESRELWRGLITRLSRPEPEEDPDDWVRPHPRQVRREFALELARTVRADGRCPPASPYSDLIQAALSRVNWLEVAEALLTECHPVIAADSDRAA